MRVWAEIELAAIRANLAAVREQAGPGVEILTVVKANAYGHGAPRVALALEREGVRCLCVADGEEALALRRGGVRSEALILGSVLPEEVPPLLGQRVAFSVNSAAEVRTLEETAARLAGRPGTERIAVHLNVDTGMGRLGCLPEEAPAIAEEIARSPHLALEGLSTHFASAEEEDPEPTREQLRRYNEVRTELERMGLRPRLLHAANSAALARGLVPGLNAVRPGITLYGMRGNGGDAGLPLRPVLSLKTRVVFIKDVPVGATAGYGRTWRASRPSRIATLPVGYEDGYSRALANRARVLLGGCRAPVVGRISMDYTTVDVTDVPGVSPGDEAVLIGRQGGEEIRAEEVAELAGTIPYEITCALGVRVGRIYV